MQYIKKDKMDFEIISKSESDYIDKVCKKKHTIACRECQSLGYNNLDKCMRG